ncbi:MAG: hypothetical protein ACOYXR_12605 [Nitrospirota bacterium]
MTPHTANAPLDDLLTALEQRGGRAAKVIERLRDIDALARAHEGHDDDAQSGGMP